LVNIAHNISDEYEYKLNIYDISTINNYYDYLITDNSQKILIKNYEPGYYAENGYYKDIKEIIGQNFIAETKLELISKFINKQSLYFKLYPHKYTDFKHNLKHNIEHSKYNGKFVRYGEKINCEEEKILIHYVEFLITEYLLKFNIYNQTVKIIDAQSYFIYGVNGASGFVTNTHIYDINDSVHKLKSENKPIKITFPASKKDKYLTINNENIFKFCFSDNVNLLQKVDEYILQFYTEYLTQSVL